MKRKDFLNSACLFGVCSCVGMPFISNSKLFAGPSNNQKKEEDWRMGFMQRRFAKLVDVVDSKVGDKKRDEIIEQLGRECAKEYRDSYIKYKDNIEGYFAEIKSKWIDTVDYNKEEKTIKLAAKKTSSCGCPFVDKSLIKKEFCKCSLGYQKEVYEAIFGRPVESKLVESILYGDERCSFLITIG